MLKFLKYIIRSILIGLISVIIINFCFSWCDFYIPLNPLSIFFIGFFHIPGLIVLLIILIL